MTWTLIEDTNNSLQGDWELQEEPVSKTDFLSESPVYQFGKSIVRGAGKAISNVLERSAKHQQEASLPALLGFKPDVSTEKNISKFIEENIPEESEQLLPSLVGKGIEYAAAPESLILGGPGTAFAMGATGKALEKAGAPKWLQMAGEIGISLFKPGAKKTYTEKSPEIQAAQKLMKEQGLAENEITLATNALKEKKNLENAAKMYKSTEKLVESTKENLEKGVKDIISESFPGFKKGIQEVEQRAERLFDPINEEAKNLIILKPEKFTKKVDSIMDDVKNTLANSPDELSFIKMLETAKDNAVSGRSAETYVNFYQTLNRIGKWVDPSKKERYMREAKDSIKQTFRDNGPFGQKLANDFEKANAGWVKYHQADKVNNILEKSYINERLDFSNLNKSLSKENNYTVFKEALGNEAASNLKLMSKIGEQVERSSKSIKGGSVKQWLTLGKAFGLANSFMTLNPKTIAAAGFAAGSIEAGRFLATQLLTNPRYQHLWLRMADKLKSGSINQAVTLSRELEKMAEKDFNETQATSK